jgi:hypothetical protein
MKVAAYVRPGIFPQGLLWNEVWIDTLGCSLQSLSADGARLDEYLRRRLAASHTIEDPIAFVIAAIHGSTGRQITAPMRALARTYAQGKARPVCRRGATTCDRASKPSFGNVTAYTAKQGDRPVIG